MTDFHRLLSAYRDAVMVATVSPGPRQVNWLLETELKVLEYVNALHSKIDVMLDLYPVEMYDDDET